ncbi:hypothetical protein [Pseudomonas graminis]
MLASFTQQLYNLKSRFWDFVHDGVVKLLKKIVMICVLVSTGCTVPAETQQPVKSQVTPPITPQSTAPANAQLKAPIRKSGPNAVFKSTKSPEGVANCLHNDWSASYKQPGSIMKKESFDAEDENGVTHTFTRSVVDEAATKAAKDDWKKNQKYYALMEKNDFKIVKEKWGYSVRKKQTGSKMVDIYAEDFYSVVNYYFPDVSQYPTRMHCSAFSETSPSECVRVKYDPLQDSGIMSCVKASLVHYGYNDENKNGSGQRNNDGLFDNLFKLIFKISPYIL